MVGTDDIVLIPSTLGVTSYIETIVVTPVSGDAFIRSNNCDRTCSSYSGFNYVRELSQPSAITTVKSALASFGFLFTNYNPYSRNFNTNIITSVRYSDLAKNLQSLVFMHKSMSDGQIAHALRHLGNSREILPARLA